MSTLKVDNIRHNSATSDAITMASDGTCTAKITSINGGSQLSHRNKIHNGSFIINQRGGPYTSTGSENMMDRFSHGESASFTFDTTTTVDSSGPAGFRKSLKITPDSTQTPTGGQNAFIGHRIEGQDLQDLCFGTSSAKKITISFYAKSSSQNNNHQYTLQIRKYDDSNNRNMVNRAFTVTSSWQRFIMTFDGDTAENIRNDTSAGMQILWHLSTGPDDIHGASTTFGRTVNNSLYSGVTGQSNFMDNTSNEFYLTGVQLEVGDTATSFEHRSFGEELSRCQRYYYQVGGQTNDGSPDNTYGVILPMAMCASATRVKGILHHPVNMRSQPSLSGGGSGTCAIQQGDNTPNSTLVYQNGWSSSNTTRYSWVDLSPNSGTISNVGETGVVYAYNSTYHIKVSAEL